MTNLFIVFTPFQLFIAQQIIRQENLSNNVLIQSYVKGYGYFLDIYNIMLMPNQWDKAIVFDDFILWDGTQLHSYLDVKYVYNNYKKIKYILKENNVGTIFMGEHQNRTLRFTAKVFSKLGYKIAFFEEGAAHYVKRYYNKPDLWTKIKIHVLDFVYYIPIYRIRFAKYRYIDNCPGDDIPIDIRYSVIPLYKEPFDKILHVQKLMSENVMRQIHNEVNSDDGKRILLMTDPMRELLPAKYLHLYFETIKETVNDLKQTTIYLKFHPRDLPDTCEKIKKIIQNSGLKYNVLCEKMSTNIPVEYYLQEFSFDTVYIFNASTYLYNGYIYPKVKFFNLLNVLNEKCKSAGATRLEAIERIIKAYNNYSINDKN